MLRIKGMVVFILLNFGFIRVEASFNKEQLTIQRLIYQMKLDSAEELLVSELGQSSSKIITHYLYSKCYFLKSIALQDETTYVDLLSISKKSIAAIKASNENENKNFFLEEIYFFRGIVKARKNKLIDAADDLMSAYRYGKKSLENYPQQKAALSIVGLIEAGLDNLPDMYKGIANKLGFKADLNGGIRKLNSFYVAKNIKFPEWKNMKLDAGYYLSLLHLHQRNDIKTSAKFVQETTIAYKTNPLHAFIRANHELKKGNADAVISILSNCARYKKSSQLSIPFLNYLWGEAYLLKGNYSLAKLKFKQFLIVNTSKDFIKTAYQRLGWISILEGQKGMYYKYMDELKTKGAALFENDQQAQKEAEVRIAPSGTLLKARILFDAKKFQSALAELADKKIEDFTSKAHQTEFCYRKGRIYHKLNKNSLAIAFYKAAIETGQKLPNYFASYSALYTADLFLASGQKENAQVYYQKATSFRANKEYKNSIERKAKMGLKKCK